MSKDNNRDLEKAQSYLEALADIVSRRLAAGTVHGYAVVRLLNGIDKVRLNLPLIFRKEIEK